MAHHASKPTGSYPINPASYVAPHHPAPLKYLTDGNKQLFTHQTISRFFFIILFFKQINAAPKFRRDKIHIKSFFVQRTIFILTGRIKPDNHGSFEHHLG
jgi:hypothetical protein